MKIRPMRDTELGFAAECARKEGWLGETEEVFRSFYQIDPKGCLIGEENDSPLGVCVAVSYGDNGFIGELIVLKKYRGNGFGRKLMEHSMAYLQGLGCKSISLDGDEPATQLYEKLGFKHICKSLRFLGELTKKELPHVKPMTHGDFDQILPMDRHAFGADRSAYLKRRLQLFPELCRTMFNGQTITGYIMGQPGCDVISIGPWVVSDSADNPLDLLETMAGDHKLRIPVLESNSRAIPLLRSMNSLKETTPSFRMVFGQSTRLGMSTQLFSVGSAAKG